MSFPRRIPHKSSWADPCWVASKPGFGHGDPRKELSKGNFSNRDDEEGSAFAFVGLLKASTQKKDLSEGSRIHAEISRKNWFLLEHNPHLATALIRMYAECGELEKAKEVLEDNVEPNVVCWNALIAGYTKHGQVHEAFKCLEKMQQNGIYPDAFTFICMLRACGKSKSIQKGILIHDEIVARGLLGKDIVLGNVLVGMYAKCGMLGKAQEVLEELPSQDIVTWNTLISEYAHHGQSHEALRCFDRMRTRGLSPDSITFICILTACGQMRAIAKGKQIHDEIVSNGLLANNVFLGTSLIDMYAKCGLLLKAREVLERLPVRNVVSWNALVAGYAQQGLCHEALNCVEQMQKEHLCPNVVTFICILKACAIVGSIEEGRRIHEEIVSRGLLGKDIVLGNSLVDMYVKCGMLVKAQEVLKELPVRDNVSWNALIAGYAQNCHDDNVMDCFQQMQSEGLSPDAITFTCIIQVCGRLGYLEKGKQIHNEILSMDLLENDIVLGTALVDMYAKCEILGEAYKVLEELPLRNVVSWSALIAGHAHQGNCHDALNCFEQMQNEGIFPNAITFLSILKACATIGAIERGKQIHDEIVSRGFLEKNIVLANALVDMYAKCGALEKAQIVLKELNIRDVISWNALIAGFAQQGHGLEALDSFRRMQSEGIVPDDVTFLSVLSACGHSGLLDEAQMVFDNMTENYGIFPKLEHQTCLMVCFGCAGHFDKAISVIKSMPYSDDPGIWLALLGSCRKWTNVKLGRLVFDQVVQLDNCFATPYILMADIFVATGMQEDAKKVEAMRLKYAVSKKRGHSMWDDAGEIDHSQSKDIYAKLKANSPRMPPEGYSPALLWMAQDSLHGEKEDIL